MAFRWWADSSPILRAYLDYTEGNIFYFSQAEEDDTFASRLLLFHQHSTACFSKVSCFPKIIRVYKVSQGRWSM